MVLIGYLRRSKDKSEINNLKEAVSKLDEVSKMDNSDVCTFLGGVQDECNKLHNNTKVSKNK